MAQLCNVRKVGVGRKVVIISGNSTIEKGLPKAKRSGTWMSHLKGRVTMQEKKEWRKKKHNKEILHIYFFILHTFLFGVSSEYLADKMFVEIVNMFVKLLFALVDAHIVHTNMTESLFCLL